MTKRAKEEVGVEAPQTNQPEQEIKTFTDLEAVKEEMKELREMKTTYDTGFEKVPGMEVELVDVVIINGKQFGPGLATLPADAFPVFKHAMKKPREE